MTEPRPDKIKAEGWAVSYTWGPYLFADQIPPVYRESYSSPYRSSRSYSGSDDLDTAVAFGLGAMLF